MEIEMSSLFGGVYKGKRVFITGHSGFKGSWLSLWLTLLGAKVVGYSLGKPTKPNHFSLLKPRVKSIAGDVLDKKRLLSSIRKARPDIVFHLAAQPIVRRSYLNPVETLETNFMGTVNVLESCRKGSSVGAIVVVTSDKCYQNRELTRGYKETDPLGGDDPYSASKCCAEHVTESYRKSFFNVGTYGKDHSTLLASARAGNVIGGGDWAEDRLIPDIVRAANKGITTIVRNQHAVRPWQHVLEPLSGYLYLGAKLLAHEKEFADAWNFGPSKRSTLSVEEVVKVAKKHWGKIKYKVENPEFKPHETSVLMLDSTKSKNNLGWRGVWESKFAVEKTMHWYREFYENKKVVTRQDLDLYIKDAKQALLPWAI